MANKTKQEILDKLYISGVEWVSTNRQQALKAMDAWHTQQSAEDKQRIKELEEGLAKIARGPLIGESNRFSDHVVHIAKQLLNQ